MTYEQIVSSVKKALAKADVSKVKNNIAVQVDIVGEGEGAFYVSVSDSTLAIEPYEYYDHDAKLIISGKDCVDLFNGKLDAVKAYTSGQITVEGNVESVSALKDMIPAKKAAAKKAPAKKAPAKKTAAKKTAAKKTTAKKAAKPAAAKKTEAPKAEVKVAEKPAAEKKAEAPKTEVKAAEKSAAPKAEAKPAEKKAPAKKPAAKKTTTAKKASK